MATALRGWPYAQWDRGPRIRRGVCRLVVPFLGSGEGLVCSSRPQTVGHPLLKVRVGGDGPSAHGCCCCPQGVHSR